MKTKLLIIALSLAVILTPARADLYFELALEGGGDDLAGTNTGEDISAGGGIKFAIGIQNPINEDATAAIRLSVGYLFDSIDAANGDADLDTITFDALYIINSGVHSFGVGGTMHMSPEYSDDVDGFRPLKIEFDDAIGVLLQYGYQVTPAMELGFRFTDIEYEDSPITVDASSFGIFLSNGF